jgi:hypothetical protein
MLVLVLTKEPVGSLIVPYKGMAAHGYAMFFGKFKIRDGVFKSQSRFKVVLARVCLVKILVKVVHGLHIILTSEAVELICKKLHVSLGMEIDSGDGSANLKIWFIGGFEIHNILRNTTL